MFNEIIGTHAASCDRVVLVCQQNSVCVDSVISLDMNVAINLPALAINASRQQDMLTCHMVVAIFGTT